MIFNRRAVENPLDHLRMMTVTDKDERRALTQQERTALLQRTAAAGERNGMSGYERSLLYRLALETGLRVRELWSLTVGAFDFDALAVTVRAGYAKAKRQDTIPLRAETAEELKRFFAGKMPTVKAFNIPAPNKNGKFDKVTRIFHADRDAAEIAYEVNGRKIDFHTLRHTFVTEIVRGGATVKEAQTLARHSKPEMTIGIYSHVGIKDTRRVIDRLQTTGAVELRTGTDDQPVTGATVTENRCTPTNAPINAPIESAKLSINQHGSAQGTNKGGNPKTAATASKTAILSEKRRGRDSNPGCG